MFSTPKFGWTSWKISGHKIGSISYIDDVPFIFINTCCDYLTNPVGFNIVFDGEGNDHGLSLIGNYFCTYSFQGEEPPYLSEITPVSDFILDKKDGIKFIEKLLEEALNDFEQDFDFWAEWNPGLYEEETEIEEERKALSTLLDKAKDILAKKPYYKTELDGDTL